MPILARRMKKSFDENGVSLISVEGNYFGLLIKLLEGFAFSWRAICDRDALLNISRGKIMKPEGDIKTSQVFHSLHNANLLSTVELAQLQNAQAQITTLGARKTKETHPERYPNTLFAELNKIARRHK